MTGYGVAIPLKRIGINRRTSNKLGVYTVEMLAVLVALRWVEKTKQDKVLICSDSTSTLASIRSFHSDSRQGYYMKSFSQSQEVTETRVTRNANE